MHINKKRGLALFHAWVWKMAWRDVRRNFSRLFLFVSSLIVGIAALVSISALNYTLQDSINQNAKALLGADLVLSSAQPFTKKTQHIFDSMRLERAMGTELLSMAMFMNKEASQLVNVVALSRGYPFYGTIECHPSGAYEKIKQGGYIVLDETLMSQYNIGLQDSVKIGDYYFEVAGKVTKTPTAGGITQMYVPSVYIALHDLDSTGLLQYGSRVAYKYFFKIEGVRAVDRVVEQLDPIFIKQGYTYTTVKQQKESMGKSVELIYYFFSFLAFVSLILGCVGVATSVHTYAREKRHEASVLRCIGSSGWQAFTIFFVQVFVLGLIGSILGAGLGVLIQQSILPFLRGYVVVGSLAGILWKAAAEGFLLGVIVSALFAALPLISIRFVPPLVALRVSALPRRPFSTITGVLIILVFLFPFFAAWYQTKDIFLAFYFTVVLAMVCGSLSITAYALLAVSRKYIPQGAGFFFRHALSNLFRPNNQTVTLIMSIGLGVFIMSLLHIVQYNLLKQVEFSDPETQSNVILFDIQPTQKQAVLDMLKQHALEADQIVPIVTCRLQQIKDRTVVSLRQDSTHEIPKWALTREYRVTYRDTLNTSEKLLEGEIQKIKNGRLDSVGVTISKKMHDNLQVEIGDVLIFDIQGFPLSATISGIREVNWPQDPPNFIFVFPTHLLEEAPQVWVATARVNDQNMMNALQQNIVLKFPNISLIDLRLILRKVNSLFEKMGWAVRFLAFFTIVTAMVVLAGAVLNTRYIRIKENTLLRALGAKVNQLSKIAFFEYAFLGFFSALAGIALSFVFGWVLIHFVLEMSFSFGGIEIVIIAVSTVLITLFMGWLNSRQATGVPPWQVLRREG